MKGQVCRAWCSAAEWMERGESKASVFQGFLAFSFFKYCFHKPINLYLPGLSPRVFTLLQDGEDTPYSWEYSSKKPLREWWSHLRWHMPWFNLSSLAYVCTLGPAPYFLSEGMLGLDAIWEELFLHELLAAFKSLLKVWKIWDSSVWGCWASPRSLPPTLHCHTEKGTLFSAHVM